MEWKRVSSDQGARTYDQLVTRSDDITVINISVSRLSACLALNVRHDGKSVSKNHLHPSEWPGRATAATSCLLLTWRSCRRRPMEMMRLPILHPEWRRSNVSGGSRCAASLIPVITFWCRGPSRRVMPLSPPTTFMNFLFITPAHVSAPSQLLFYRAAPAVNMKNGGHLLI